MYSFIRNDLIAMPPPIVCLVDDNVDFRLLASTVFDKYIPWYSLQVFADGRQFLEHLVLMESKPNLVILDQHMPDLSGYQVLLAFRTCWGIEKDW